MERSIKLAWKNLHSAISYMLNELLCHINNILTVFFPGCVSLYVACIHTNSST